jgi:ribosome-associated protein
VEQLRRALHVERRRRATKPTAASRERRLQGKKERSEVKRLRRAPGPE